MKFGLTCCVLLTVTAAWPTARGQQSSQIDLARDQPVTLRFGGSSDAELFSKEIEASFNGVLQKNFVAQASNGLPRGFVSASPPGQPWAGTMWTRDTGTYIRELTMRGYYQHAALISECLMRLVEKNKDGFYSFPRFFRGDHSGSGTEVDGTASIVIGMNLLWERLPDGDTTKNDIQQFLLGPASPVGYFRFLLRDHDLIEGTGEFGCGMRLPGSCYNVVQNNLVMLALLASGRMADEAGHSEMAAQDRDAAAKLHRGMEKYLAAPDGTWFWCINSKTLQPDPKVLNAAVNRGFGGTDGVFAMDADVLGMSDGTSQWEDAPRGIATLLRIYSEPLRKAQFDRYGIWTQFDALAGGLLTSPSYGQGYAIEDMLLSDKMAMAEKGLSFLAEATYSPPYPLPRDSRYYFYERYYSPDAVGKVALAAGCGALNLVNVTEPLKIARLLLGVDDESGSDVEIVPRLPPGWDRIEAANWPIKTHHGIARASITFVRSGEGYKLTIKLAPGQSMDHLRVRMPGKDGFSWYHRDGVRRAKFETY